MMNNAQRRRVNANGRNRGRRRSLVFEQLDVRAVLSAAGPPMDILPHGGPDFDVHERFDGGLVGGELPEYAAGYGVERGPAYDASSSGGMPGGNSALFDGGGPVYANSQSLGAPPTFIYDAGGLGTGVPVLIVISGWNLPQTHLPEVSLLWLDSLGPSNAPSQSYSGSMSGASPGPHDMSVAPAIAASNSATGSSSSRMAPAVGTVEPAAWFASGLSSSVSESAASSAASSASPAAQGARSILFVLPAIGATSATVPGRDAMSGTTSDEPAGAADDSPRLDGDGGWIELEAPRRSRSAPALSDQADDEPVGTDRARGADDRLRRDELWKALINALDAEDDETTDDAVTKSVPARKAGDDAAPAEQAVARYDQGGAIELEAGGANGKTTGALASPAIARAMQELDAGPITLEAGVALFQAFELGAGPADAQIDAAPAVEVPPTAAPASGSSEAKVDEGGDTLHQAAGVGLGLLAALPFARRRKRAEDQRRAVRPKSSGD